VSRENKHCDTVMVQRQAGWLHYRKPIIGSLHYTCSNLFYLLAP